MLVFFWTKLISKLMLLLCQEKLNGRPPSNFRLTQQIVIFTLLLKIITARYNYYDALDFLVQAVRDRFDQPGNVCTRICRS